MDNVSEKMVFEVLQMARELVINEHTDRRAQLHNQWLYESQHLWNTQKIRLKYPDIPPYPTEQDVIERAQILLKFLVLGKSKDFAVEGTKLTIDENEPLEKIESNTISLITKDEKLENIEDDTISLITKDEKLENIEHETTSVIEVVLGIPFEEEEKDSSTSFGGILPNVFKKMRSKF